jgi:cell division cycle 14
VQEYEYYEKVENGDLNWVIPNEVLAFMGPSGKSYDKNGSRLHTPDDYSKLFNALNVERVIRLNKPTYDKNRFERFGFKVDDLYFIDGSTPSIEIINDFIEFMEN